MASAHLLYLIYGRQSAAGVDEDIAMTTHHFYCPEASWPGTAPFRYEEAETVTLAFWDSLRTSYYNAKTQLIEMRWYREDDLEPPWGAPARVTGVSGKPGTSTADSLPPQTALCVTEFTDLEEREEGRTVRHWGRFYLPAMVETYSDADGRVSTGTVTNVADYVDTWYQGMVACALQPAVRITGWGGTALPQSGWAPVKQIRINNVWDTIRRRKYENITAAQSRDITL